jgi:hypothetical protein
VLEVVVEWVVVAVAAKSDGVARRSRLRHCTLDRVRRRRRRRNVVLGEEEVRVWCSAAAVHVVGVMGNDAHGY